MVSSRQIRISEGLIDQMGRISRPIAEKIKKDYGLQRLDLDFPTMSELVAGKLSKRKNFNFKIHRTSKDSGKLILL